MAAQKYNDLAIVGRTGLHSRQVPRANGALHEQVDDPYGHAGELLEEGEGGAGGGGSVELLSRCVLEPAKDANHSVMHDVLPAELVSVYHLYGRKGYFVQLTSDTGLASIGLMPFGT